MNPGVNFQVTVDIPRVKHVKGDYHRISQIIHNFISNAAKFTKHGSIEFSVREGIVRPQENLAQILFSVKDTGIGMSSETMAKLFRPFQQVPFHSFFCIQREDIY